MPTPKQFETVLGEELETTQFHLCNNAECLAQRAFLIFDEKTP